MVRNQVGKDTVILSMKNIRISVWKFFRERNDDVVYWIKNGVVDVGLFVGIQCRGYSNRAAVQRPSVMCRAKGAEDIERTDEH